MLPKLGSYSGSFTNSEIDEATPELNDLRSKGCISYNVSTDSENNYVENSVVYKNTAERLLNIDENTLIYDTDLNRLYVWNTSTDSWQVASSAIYQDTIFYVDGDTGDDSNSGLSWGTAFKTFDFLYSGSSYKLSREINANVVVLCRGTILSTTVDTHINVDNFYGTGTLTVEGVMSELATGILVTAYDNGDASTLKKSFLEAAAETWTVDAYKGKFILVTSGTGAGATMYPIISNTATRLETFDLPLLGLTSVVSILEGAKLKAATVAAPTVLIDYPWDGIGVGVTGCNVEVEFKNLDMMNMETATNYSPYAVKGCSKTVTFTNTSSPLTFVLHNGKMIGRRIALFLKDYSYTMCSSNSELVLSNAVIVGDGTTYGWWGEGDAFAYLGGCRLSNHAVGVGGFSSNICDLGVRNLFDSCAIAIDCSCSTIMLEIRSAAYPTCFNTCVTCINLGGGHIQTSKSGKVYTLGTTNDILIDDEGNTETFANMHANKVIKNDSGGSVLYYNATTYATYTPESVTKIKVSELNVSNPPTVAELTGEFGAPSAVGAGFTVCINDNASGVNFYQAISDGTNWWTVACVKAS